MSALLLILVIVLALPAVAFLGFIGAMVIFHFLEWLSD